ncbi:MAG TPA: hypothetical protein VFH27_05710 [Longimicrobiaceae bacterium]|nr:hypothetical protein [Longimicrobiaceae bacterium]
MRSPSGLHCGIDVHGTVVEQEQFVAAQPDACLDSGEEVRIGFLRSQACRVEDAVHVFGKTQRFHQIGGPEVLLVGRQIHPGARGAKPREFRKEGRDEARIVLEPVGDEGRRAYMGRDRPERGFEALHEPGTTDHDVVPVRSEEHLVERVRRKPEIFLNG